MFSRSKQVGDPSRTHLRIVLRLVFGVLLLVFCFSIATPTPARAQGPTTLGDRLSESLGLPNPAEGTAVRPENLVSITVFENTVVAGERNRVEISVEIADGWHINEHEKSVEFLEPTKLRLKLPAGLTLREIVYPETHRKKFPFVEEPIELFAGTAVFTLVLDAAENLRKGTLELNGRLEYQPCNDTVCLLPEKKDFSALLNVVESVPSRTASESAGLETPVDSLTEPPAVQPNAPGDSSPAGDTAYVLLADAPAAPTSTGFFGYFSSGGEKDVSPLLILAMVFLGGLALNLTPCVYPMIPVTVAHFGQGRLTRPRLGAFLYFLGIVLTYSILGTVAGFTGGLFGAILQHPVTSVGLALLMVLLAASSFGWIAFKLPAALSASADRLGRGTGSFGLGATMGIVAAPCIGPVVVALLAYIGARQSATEGWLLFTVLGAGLGAPYLLLGLLSNRLARLPSAGAWMERVKPIFGFILLGMAVYFLAPILSDIWELRLYSILLFLAAIFIFVRSCRGESGKSRWAGGAVAGALVLTSLWLLSPPAQPVQPEGWVPYTEDGLAAAAAAGQPVLLDFYAEWCLPCKELDRTTFSDERVVRALTGTARVKVDLTRHTSPEAIALRKEYAVWGVPTVVYLDGHGEERFRFVRYFKPEELLQTLKQQKWRGSDK